MSNCKKDGHYMQWGKCTRCNLSIEDIFNGEDPVESMLCDFSDTQKFEAVTVTNNAVVPTIVASNSVRPRVEEKVLTELLPPIAVMAVAKVLTFGAKKHAAEGWRTTTTVAGNIGAALRHLFKHMMGDTIDEESGLPHLSHASCRLLFASELFIMEKK